MTIFGIIWCLLIIYCLSKNNIKYITFLTLFSMIFQSTNIIDNKFISMGPQVITNITFIIYCIFKYHSILFKKPQKKDLIIIIGYALFLVIIISSILSSSLTLKLFRIIQLLIYLTTFSIITKISDKYDKKFIHDSILIITIFVLIMGLIQILITTSLISRSQVISELFYNDIASNVYYWHFGYDRICSVFMEASYCGAFLCGALFYFLNYYKQLNLKSIILILLILIEIILTKSTSAYISCFLCTILFIIFSKDKKLKILLILFSLITFLILFIFFKDVLNTVIFNKLTSGSAITRYNWNLYSINAFKSSPLIGIGYKNIRGSSIICSLLGQIGIIGLLLYLAFNILIIIKNKKNKFALSILSIFIIQIIACPDLDFCVYWLFLFLLGILYKEREVKYENI